MPEGEDLRIERVAHQVQPRAADLCVVPDLLPAAAIGDCGIQRLDIPEIRRVEDHRHSLEVAAACYLGKLFHK